MFVFDRICERMGVDFGGGLIDGGVGMAAETWGTGRNVISRGWGGEAHGFWRGLGYFLVCFSIFLCLFGILSLYKI